LALSSFPLRRRQAGASCRDLLIGESPPEALRGWPIVTAGLLGAFAMFFAFHTVEEVPEPALIAVDALGLSLLAVSGTEKALEFRLTPIAAVMMGAISGAGSYTIREILLAEIPAVLRVDFLATAAIIGAIVLVVAQSLKAPAKIAALLGGATCFGLRIVAVWQHWRLPTANLTNELTASLVRAQIKAPRREGPTRGGSALELGGKISALNHKNKTSARLFPDEPESLLRNIRPNPGSFSHAEFRPCNAGSLAPGMQAPEGKGASKMRISLSAAAFS
jgi:uncharacterized membrane protein YeiH